MASSETSRMGKAEGLEANSVDPSWKKEGPPSRAKAFEGLQSLLPDSPYILSRNRALPIPLQNGPGAHRRENDGVEISWRGPLPESGRS